MITREFLYTDGVRRCAAFLRANGYKLPVYSTTRPPRSVALLPGECLAGVYQGGRCWVALQATALPNNAHWPCWKTDRTAVGVAAHETGHYIADVLRAQVPIAVWKQWLADNRTKLVSGYEPTPHESLAETLRLFILNPALLEAAVPWRFAFCTETMGLRLTERRSWRVVLGNAELAKRAERWVRA